MAAPTAQSLVRGLGARNREFALAAPTGGSATTLVDATLDQVLPQNVGSTTAPLACWVYGATDALGSSNRGVERRGSTYVQNTHTLTFLAAWPASITGGHYEIYTRHPHSLLLEAINSGVRQLGYYFWRSYLDEAAITTVANTWQYTLPAGVQWRAITDLLVQITTNPGLTGYPYVDAKPWNWTIDRITDATGATAYRLQFAVQPPPGRLLRIIGSVQYADLVADADVLPLDVADQGPATEFLYDWAQYQLVCWDAVGQPALQTEWLTKQGDVLQKKAADLRDRLAKPPKDVVLVTPGSGDGQAFSGAAESPAYMGAFSAPWL